MKYLVSEKVKQPFQYASWKNGRFTDTLDLWTHKSNTPHAI